MYVCTCVMYTIHSSSATPKDFQEVDFQEVRPEGSHGTDVRREIESDEAGKVDAIRRLDRRKDQSSGRRLCAGRHDHVVRAVR